VAPAPPSADDPRVVQALEEYIAAMEAGSPPPRDEFVARHADVAGVLADCLFGLEMVHHAGHSGPTGRPAPLHKGDGAAEMEPLGDFQIVREVGRGGMGVVYEAVQRSLGRRVALKVLPFAATLDPRHLQRFHNEARAAAGLHHTNIVPVYAVGVERGVHFYAMQFIDGHTLADFIAQERGDSPAVPTVAAAEGAPASATTAAPAAQATSAVPRDPAYFRRVAEWGIQAAEALDCAHQLGVVHRDVKPANLLVDGTGRLWVTDFGLAHVQSDARLTMTGDLVGTLRYMSPEQALAKRVVIDHRTDVYSLGATLYELLTLEPAFRGADRQELLRQIAFEEPKAPRRVSKAIPAELETVVLKAMEKNAADRYATAKELADDLRRWLADEPIRARPAGLVRRLRKWGRRHPAVVAAMAAALTAAALMLGGSIGWVAKDRAAQAQRTADEESIDWQRRRRVPEALAAARRAQAALAGGHADAEMRRSIEARVHDLDFVARLEEARLGSIAVKDDSFDYDLTDRRCGEVFREFGLDVEAWSAEEAGKHIRESSVGLELAALLDDWAMLRRSLNPQDEARWKHLLDVARAADPDRWRTQLRDVLASKDQKALVSLAFADEAMQLPPWTLGAVGRTLWHTGALRPAEALLRKAQQQQPDDFWINYYLAEVIWGSKPEREKASGAEEAIPFLRVCVALHPQSPGAHVNLGAALYDKGDLDGTVAAFREAIRLKNDYPDAHSNLSAALHDKGDMDGAIAACHEALRIKDDHARAHTNLGAALRAKGDLDGAISEFRKAIALDPKLVTAHNNLGAALFAKGDPDGAIAEYRRAIGLNKGYALPHHNLGNALRARGDLDGAIAAYRQATELGPKDAHVHYNLGAALRARGDVDGAVAAYRQAIAINKDYALAHYALANALRDKGDLDGAIAEYRQAVSSKEDYADAHLNLGNALYKKGDLDGAIAAFRGAIRIKPDLAAAHVGLGSTLATQGNPDGAIAAFRDAIRFEPGLAEAYCDLGLSLRDKAQFVEALGYLRRGHELGSQSPRWSVPSARWVRECERFIELEPNLLSVLSGRAAPANPDEAADYARLCQKKHHYASATRLYREAITAKPALASAVNGLRYDAACAAALAAGGAGEGVAGLSEGERAALRRQALDWLRADLEDWWALLDKEPDKARPTVAQRMAHWQCDPELNSVRGPDVLSRLPEVERREWLRLWADVAATGGRAQDRSRPTDKKDLGRDVPRKD
jgi:tetratricopeptide (TPR) repeat protein/serine/threonine protein kinase